MSAYYAVAKGKTVGIFSTWDECQAQVKNISGAIFKKFSSQAEAEQFIRDKTGLPFNVSKPAQTKEPEPKTITPEVASVTSAMGNQIRTGIGRTAQMISPIPLSRANPVANRPSVAKVKISFDLRRELHDAQRELTTLKQKLPLDGETEASYGKVQERLAKVLTYLDDKAEQMKSEASEVEGPSKSKKRKEHDKFLVEGMQTATSLDSSGFLKDSDGFVHVFTDGACSDNGRGFLSKAGIGVWWSDNHPLNLAEPVSGTKATNNAAEIQAAIRAIETAKQNSIQKLWIQTDSMFLINCITKWISGWKRNGWVTSTSNPVINKDDLVKLDNLVNSDNSMTIRWGYVKAHKGIHGNEAADELARSGAARFSRKRKGN